MDELKGTSRTYTFKTGKGGVAGKESEQKAFLHATTPHIHSFAFFNSLSLLLSALLKMLDS